MLRVALIAENYPPDGGGIATSAARLAQALAGRVEIEVASFPRGQADKPERWKTSRPTANLTLHSLSPFVNGWSRPWPAAVRARLLERAACRLVGRFREHKIDVIHGFGLQNAGLVAARVAIELGRPLIQSVRGNDAGRNSFDASRRPALRFALAPASRIVAVNCWLADLIAWNWPELTQRVLVVPNGVRVQPVLSDAKLRQARRILGLPADAPVVGTVGTVREKKGPFALNALMRGFLRPARGRLLVIGELRLDEFRALGWTGDPADDEVLIVHKAETRDELRLLISLCDWLVYPSLDDGMANALLETMEAGRPVIVSPVFGDVVRDGRDGLVASSLAPDEFVRKNEWLWASPDARRALGKSARNRVMARFDQDFESASWLELYNQALFEALLRRMEKATLT